MTEPVDVPMAEFTVILYNAGGHRRIGPNRMWTDAARRWADRGVPVIRVDLEGIGDAEGDSSRYRDVSVFYQSALVVQAKAVLELAVSIGLPNRFLTGGICSGAFWAFQVALSDTRVTGIVAVNPGMLVFDSRAPGRRTVRRLGRLFGPDGIKRLIHAERSPTAADFAAFVLALHARRRSPALPCPIFSNRNEHTPEPDSVAACLCEGERLNIIVVSPIQRALLCAVSHILRVQVHLSRCGPAGNTCNVRRHVYQRFRNTTAIVSRKHSETVRHTGRCRFRTFRGPLRSLS